MTLQRWRELGMHRNLHEITMVEWNFKTMPTQEVKEWKKNYLLHHWCDIIYVNINLGHIIISLCKSARVASKVPHTKWLKEQKCIIWLAARHLKSWCQSSWLLGRPLFWACRWSSSLYVLTGSSLCEACVLISFSLKKSSDITSVLTLVTSVKINYVLKTVSLDAAIFYGTGG